MIVRRGAAEIGADVTDEIVELIARRAGGDARNALNILELASQTAMAEGQSLGPVQIEDAARKRPLVYDKGGDAHYDFISAFIKSMRGSDPDASVYYLAAMLEGGEDPRFIARRMIVLASEDIGLADPQALVVAVAAAQAVEHVGLPEARLNLAEAAIYLALAPKSNAVIKALGEAAKDVRELGHTARRTSSATRTTSARRSWAAARGTSTALRPPRVRGRLPARAAEGEDVLSRVQLKRGEGGRRWRLRRQRAQSGRTLARDEGTSALAAARSRIKR